MIRISILGSGNVAFHLYQAFAKENQLEVIEVYTRKSSDFFPNSIQNHDINQLKEADIFIIAISDDAIEDISSQIPFENKLVVHTAGSVSFKKIHSKNRRGVFYPLQTFSKNKEINFKGIPLCLEAENEDDQIILTQIAQLISEKVYQISEKQRGKLHLSAVFVCNFVNHLYQIGADICAKENVPFEILQPLIQETADKILFLLPSEAQTGPAVRNDQMTITSHINQLESKNYQYIYIILTESIQNVKKL